MYFDIVDHFESWPLNFLSRNLGSSNWSWLSAVNQFTLTTSLTHKIFAFLIFNKVFFFLHNIIYQILYLSLNYKNNSDDQYRVILKRLVVYYFRVLSHFSLQQTLLISDKMVYSALLNCVKCDLTLTNDTFWYQKLKYLSFLFLMLVLFTIVSCYIWFKYHANVV